MWRKRLTAHWPERLVVFLAVLVLYGDAVFTRASFFTRDTGFDQLPMHAWWRQQVLAGHFPSWLPNLGLGVPVIANPVTQTFYPFVYLTLLPLAAVVRPVRGRSCDVRWLWVRRGSHGGSARTRRDRAWPG